MKNESSSDPLLADLDPTAFNHFTLSFVGTADKRLGLSQMG